MNLHCKYILLFSALLWSHSQIKAQTAQPKTGQEMTITIGDLMVQQVKIEIVKEVQKALSKKGFYVHTIDGNENSRVFQKALKRFYEETGVRKDGGMAAIMEELDLPFPSMSTGFDEYGKCFISCQPPQEHQTISKQVLVKPDASIYPNLEPIYETQAVEVLVKEAHTEVTAIPPVFETVIDTILVQEAYTDDATLETITERIEVSPETGKWVFKNLDKCHSSSYNKNGTSPKNCEVVCWTKVRSEYISVTKKVLNTPYPVYSQTGAAQYQYIERKVLTEAASLKIINWSAEYQTKEQEMVVGYKSNGVLIPPTYITITEQIPVDGSNETNFLSPIWESIQCDTKVDTNVVKKLQMALKERGYYAGPINGIQGTETNEALKKFQIDTFHGRCDIQIATLKALDLID